MTDRFLVVKTSGIADAARTAGATVVTGNHEGHYREAELPKAKILKTAKFHREMLDCDVFINVPVLKHHGGAKLTLCIKNLMGVVWDRRFFHNSGLDQSASPTSAIGSARVLRGRWYGRSSRRRLLRWRPAQCIDFRNHRIDHSRCVMCFDCVTSCKRSGIHLTWRGGAGPAAPAETKPAPQPVADLAAVPRRTFLSAAAILPAAALAQGRVRGGGGAKDVGGGGGIGGDPGTCRGGLNQHNKRPVLPPGAVSLEHFQNLCTACHLCVANCPVRPDKAIIVNGLNIHELAWLPELGSENTVRAIEEEFPF